MLQWFADNLEGIIAILTIAAAIISMLTKAGVIQKMRGDMLTQVIEDSAGTTKRILDQLADTKKDGVVTNTEIANAIAKGLKGEARERAIKTGFKAVVNAVADGAAETDPDPTKKKRPAITRLLGLIRPKVLGG